ncbi:MAG: glycosyltransferase family 4 protein [Acidobacteria bacterium]|nr:glycosyltransferase family 4 protein [Acidobacteriota bacterium]
MRVLILSQYYFPEAVPKPHELAEGLTAAGHQVSVLTGYPHYPGGVLADGYRLGLFKKERIRDIPVLRVFELPYHSTRPLLRMANYLSFMLSAPLGALFTAKPDVIYVWHPPLTIGVAAWLISKIKRVPFVYDVQDIWGSFTVLSGMVSEGGMAIKLIRRLERSIARRSSHTIVQTEAGRDYFVERGVAEKSISILPHWIDEAAFGTDSSGDRDAIRAEFGWADRFIVLFAGNIGIVQGLESVIEAARLMPAGIAKIVLMGDGTDRPRLAEIARRSNAGDRIEFIDRQPPERMPAMMAAADALLVSLKRSELTKFVVPSKTVAYLASGRPILMAAGGASEDLIRKADAGVVAEPENAAALAEAIERMQRMPASELNRLGENGRRFLLENLSKDEVMLKYIELLRTVAAEWKK